MRFKETALGSGLELRSWMVVGSAMDMIWALLVPGLVHAPAKNTTGLCHGSLCSSDCEASLTCKCELLCGD
jgi:hypothetical protein